jgi:hypothetical protein
VTTWAIVELEAELAAEQQRSAGLRTDYERERADRMVTTQEPRCAALSAWSPRGHRQVISRTIIPIEQLTYAEIAQRLGVSSEAERAFVKRGECAAACPHGH